MNKRSRKILWMISILSFLGICISYIYLPNQIPIHWNSNWEIDQWGNKKYIFLLGSLPILILAMFEFFPKFDPRKDNYKKHAKAYDMLELAIVILMIILSWATVAITFQIDIKMKLILPAAMGITFIIIGNYMPTLKSNYFFGIKNPWTLSNDVVWRKTHKVGGYIFAISGMLMMSMAFIQNPVWNSVIVAVITVGFVGVNVYSYLIYRKIKK